jgi:hypothetical protein
MKFGKRLCRISDFCPKTTDCTMSVAARRRPRQVCDDDLAAEVSDPGYSSVIVGRLCQTPPLDEGGSASPKTKAKIIADGANIRRRSRNDFWQRVEDNAFHLLRVADAGLGVPFWVGGAGA